MAPDPLKSPLDIMRLALERCYAALAVSDYRTAEGCVREIMKAAGGLYPRLSAIADYTESANAFAEVDRALKE